jgi:signal transduction histidine kinase
MTTSAALLLRGQISVTAQSLSNDRLSIRNFTAADRITNNISDLSFDRQGMLWLVPDDDNVSVFDGGNVRKLEVPVAKGVPQSRMSYLMKGAGGRLTFLDQERKYLFRLNKTGQLDFDSALTAYDLPAYSGYRYFDWAWFTQQGGADKRMERKALRDRLFNNPSFYPFDDSTFFFIENKLSYLYRGGQRHRIAQASIDPTKIFLLDGTFVALEGNSLFLLDKETWKKQPVALTGDIMADTAFSVSTGTLLSIFPGEYPHLVCHSKLYRIRLDHGTIETIFDCNLDFLHYPIHKIAYDPLQGVTAIVNGREGLFLIQSNPFYAHRFAEPFQELKKEKVFYPITLKNKTTFVTPWSEFSGNGNYKLLDLHRPGSMCLYTDHNGNIWECGKDKLIRYDSDMIKQSEIVTTAPNRALADIRENEKGEIFCLSSQSLLKYDDGILKDLNPVHSRDFGVLCFQVLKYIGDGIFWIASSNGLYSYNERTNLLDKIDVIPAVLTLNPTQLHDGSILVTCYPENFFFLYYKQRFCKIPVRNELGPKEISSVTEDQRGRIWFATSAGLFVSSLEEIEAFCRGEKKSVYYYKYGKGDGLPVLEFNGGLNASNAISADGYLALNSMDGVVVFHQDSVSQSFPLKDVQLASLRLSGEAAPLGDSMSVSHDNDGMLIQASVPYYGDRANLALEYQIPGMVDSWKDINADGRISLSHLPHGDYTLSVRARTGLVPGLYRTKTVQIHVPSLLYETTAFRVLAFLLLALVGAWIAITIARLRRNIHQKNVSLYDKNLKLKEALTDLEDNVALKERLISLILHDLRTPLYFQSLLLNEITNDSFVNNETRELFLELKNSTAAVLKFTKDFLTWYSSQREGFTVKKTAFEYHKIVDDLFSVYGDIAARKKLALHCKSTGVHLLVTDRNILEIILRNLLDNAVKYTSSGSVSLLFERREDGDAITVTDTGQGFRPDRLKMLMDYTKKSHQQATDTFGYRFIYSLAEKIGAVINILSRPEMGASVTILIPREAPDDHPTPAQKQFAGYLNQ